MEINKPVTIIIFLIVIVILVFLFTIPKYQEYHQLQTKILEKQAQYSGESIYHAKISDILSGLETRKEVLDKIQSALPVDFSLAPLVDFLQKKGIENGISITSIVFSQISPLSLSELSDANTSGEIKDVLFTINATGGYQALKNFLFAMDNSARLFEMDTVFFSKVETLQGGRIIRNQPQEYSLKLEVRTRSY